MSFSDNEMQRRRDAVRQVMKERNLDFLIAQSSIGIFPGSVKWLSNLDVGDGYTVTVIFPCNDEMTVIHHGPTEEFPGTKGSGIKKHISLPMLPTLANGYMHAEKTAAELAPYKSARIGFAGMNIIAAGFYRYLAVHLPGAAFEDCTKMMDTLRAIKSDEELNFIKETCGIQDGLFTAILPYFKPGRKASEVRSELMHKALDKGCSGMNIVLWMSQPGTPLGPPTGNEIFKAGDQVDVMIETNGPSGYWGEMSRPVCIGRARPGAEDHIELARELQKLTVDALKPGARPADLWEANNVFLRKHSCLEERRIFAHGQGCDMVERPCLDPTEAMPVQGRMLMAVHPQFQSATGLGWLCDNFFVSKSGTAEWLHKTPQKVFIV